MPLRTCAATLISLLCASSVTAVAEDDLARHASRDTPASVSERGHGLSRDEAADGWLSLFDCETTYGWTSATIKDGRITSGATTTRFGHCELRAELDGPGSLKIGAREAKSSAGAVELNYEGPRAAIELGADTKLASLAIRPIGLKPLLNARDLSGWKRIDRDSIPEAARPRWDVENGIVRVVGGPGAIEYTGRQFGDFVAQLDVRTRSVHSNGGFFFRAIAGDFMNGYEAQLHNRCIDDDPAQPYRWATGGIDDRQNARRLASRDFETFRMTVIADGPHVATWVNGYQTVDWTDDRPPHENPREGSRVTPGVIQIQAHDPLTDYELHQVLAAELQPAP